MRKVILLAIAAAAVPLLARAETWKNVSLIDTMCVTKEAVKADPDEHTTKCALQCQKSGYGILTADGDFLKFDDAGNQQAVSTLKATKKTDRLRVSVEGERQGDQIKVKSLSLI